MLLREVIASRSISVVLGIGYRQRGFIADSRYNRRGSGYVEAQGFYTNNRFDNAAFDLALKYRRNRNTRLTPYALIGNRLDCRLNFKSDFWEDYSRNFTQFELSPLFGAGITTVKG